MSYNTMCTCDECGSVTQLSYPIRLEHPEKLRCGQWTKRKKDFCSYNCLREWATKRCEEAKRT